MIKMYLKDKSQADISGDGKINVMDFALMKKWIMQGREQKRNMMIKGKTNMEKVGAIMDQVQTETVEFFDVYDAMERMQKLALEEYGKKIGAKSKEEGK